MSEQQSPQTPRPLRVRALAFLDRYQKEREQKEKERREKEEEDTRGRYRMEAARAVTAVFENIDPALAARVEYIVHEERNSSGKLTIQYEIRLEDLRFNVSYGQSGEHGGIGLRLFDDCPVEGCPRRHSPRNIIRDALSLAFAVQALDEMLKECTHTTPEAEFDTGEEEEPAEELGEPVSPEALPSVAAQEHTTALERQEQKQKADAARQSKELCASLKRLLYLSDEPTPGSGVWDFDGMKCAVAIYGGLVFARGIEKLGGSIHLLVICSRCQEQTLSKEVIYDRQSLGRALADGTVDPWFHHMNRLHNEVKPSLTVRLRDLIEELLDEE